MVKLKEIKRYVRLTLGKLPSIKYDLVGTYDRCHDLYFEELTKELSKLVDFLSVKSDPNRDKRQEQVLQTKQKDRKPFVYCNVNNHKSSEREKVRVIQECNKNPK